MRNILILSFLIFTGCYNHYLKKRDYEGFKSYYAYGVTETKKNKLLKSAIEQKNYQIADFLMEDGAKYTGSLPDGYLSSIKTNISYGRFNRHYKTRYYKHLINFKKPSILKEGYEDSDSGYLAQAFSAAFDKFTIEDFDNFRRNGFLDSSFIVNNGYALGDYFLNSNNTKLAKYIIDELGYTEALKERAFFELYFYAPKRYPMKGVRGYLYNTHGYPWPVVGGDNNGVYHTLSLRTFTFKGNAFKLYVQNNGNRPLHIDSIYVELLKGDILDHDKYLKGDVSKLNHSIPAGVILNPGEYYIFKHAINVPLFKSSYYDARIHFKGNYNFFVQTQYYL